MKKTLFTLPLAAMLLSASCGSDELANPSLTISEESLACNFTAAGGDISLPVSANVAWVAAVSAGGDGWLTATNEDGGSVLRLAVSANENLEVRSATVTVGAAGVAPVVVSVAQLGVGASLMLLPASRTMPAAGGRFSVLVTANAEYVVDIEDTYSAWVSLEALVKGVEKDTARFVVAANGSDLSARTARVGFKMASSATVLTIVQDKMGAFNDDNFPPDTMLVVTSGTTNGGTTGTGLSPISKSYDGDVSTMYHSATNPSKPVVMSWAVKDAARLDYLVYTPRTSGPNGTIGELSIAVQYVGSADYVVLGNYNFGMTNAPSRVDFSPALVNVARVQFSVTTAGSDGTGSFFVSVAEVAFYRRGQSEFDPLIFFTDGACTELKSNVTQAKIDAIPVAVYRNAANALFDPDPKQVADYREFRIGKYNAVYNPALDASRNKTAKYGVRDNPTGISVASGEELVVLASGINAGQSVAIKVQAIAGHSDAHTGYDYGPSVSIANGANLIKLPEFEGSTGLVYVQYLHNSESALPSPVTLHFAGGGTVNGVFDSRKNTAADFERILNLGNDAYFDIIGKYAAVTLKKANIAQPARGKEFIDAIDHVVWDEWFFAGLLPAPMGYGGQHRTHAYFINLPMKAGVGAYATDFHTAYPDGEFQNLTNLSKLLNEGNASDGREVTWVLGHEHGHVNQLRPAMRWTGMTEVTNNIMAQHLQTSLGDYFPTSKSTHEATSRLLYRSIYQPAMNAYFTTGMSHGGTGRDLFHQLVPFWQLHLYLTEVLNKGNTSAGLYADVYEHFRTSDPNVSSRTQGQHQLEFVKIICQKANLNLEDFFTSWGFLTPVNDTLNDYGTASFIITQAQVNTTLNTIRQLPTLAGAKEFRYITDQNIALYKSNATIKAGGKITVTGGKILIVPSGWENVVAWELRNGSATGTLKQAFLSTTGLLLYSYNTASDKLFAVSVAGDREEVLLN